MRISVRVRGARPPVSTRDALRALARRALDGLAGVHEVSVHVRHDAGAPCPRGFVWVAGPAGVWASAWEDPDLLAGVARALEVACRAAPRRSSGDTTAGAEPPPPPYEARAAS